MKHIGVTLRSPIKPVVELRPIDDTFMQKLGENREFCEEMLRVILDNPNLRVISNTTQKSIHNIDTRSVTIDIKCIDEYDNIFSVEVQRADDDDHQKRVRYNSSCIQVQALDKGSKFKELPNVCMIFISEKDFFKRGKAIYHIDRTIRETGETVSNGYSEIYVNAEVDDGTDLAEYMQILKSSAICDNAKFPKICNLTEYYKIGKGRETMCKVVEEYAKDYAKEYAREYAKEQVKDIARNLILSGSTDDFIVNATKLTKEEVSKLRAEV